MDETQRLEIAERIRELRERSPWSQAQMAEKLDLSLRGYQKMEERGTTKWERVEELAAIFGIEPLVLWQGRPRSATPDLLSSSNGAADSDRLARIETELGQVREELEALRVWLSERAALKDEAELDRVEGPRRRRRASGNS